ncbi:hypothetical protein II582_00995 [bacterium]|nr:hypothetical protein [bacterium]
MEFDFIFRNNLQSILMPNATKVELFSIGVVGGILFIALVACIIVAIRRGSDKKVISALGIAADIVLLGLLFFFFNIYIVLAILVLVIIMVLFF